MKTIFSILITTCLLFSLSEAKADIAQADARLADFTRLTSAGQFPDTAWQSLRHAYTEYTSILRTAESSSPEWKRAKTALKEIFPQLRRGAYHYAQLNNQEKVLAFAADYVDLSLLPGMRDDRLQETLGYPVLAHLAATNIYNRGDYERAIRYFQAYLSSGDASKREMAFEGLARSYYELRNYDNAIYIASQGAEAYPQNWNILVIGVESCLKNGNDTRMEAFLDKALALRPDHNTLIEYKGRLYERTGRPDKAANIFAGLRKMNTQSLDYACHYAFNLYNNAIAVHSRIAAQGDTTGLAAANRALRLADPVLQEVLDSSPYAVNVAHALAQCRSLTGDADGLRKANEALAALSAAPVGPETPLTPETEYMPTLNFNPLQAEAPSTTRAGQSDVDINIPIAATKRPNTYVVIIGNENYKYFSNVAYAKRDGSTFAEYCRKALGVPDDNIRERYDATLSEIREPLRYLEEKTRMNPGKLDIIVYYAGHGVPNVADGTAYLLPTDASGTDFESCFGLEQLYARLDEMPAKSITVFLDACFSGATRGNEMLFAERFVEYEVEDIAAKGNTVVFSATAGNQTAMAYDDQQHGFFTYYLLKNLQSSKGTITLGDLGDALTREVDNKAYDKKNKHQTPTVNASPTLGDTWRSRTLLD